MGPTANQWNVFKNIINNAHNSFNKETLIWRRASFQKSLYGESIQNPSSQDVELETLIGFNTFRTWPITEHTDAGELDNQNMYAMLNREYLSGLGYLTTSGNFDFKPAEDLFLHRGTIYKADGDTLAAQAMNDPLFVYLILVRQEITTGTDRAEQE